MLVPDKERQDEIDKLVGTDAKKAVDMIKACILPVYMDSIESFRDKKDIVNKLGNHMSINKGTSTTVVLGNGAIISTDSGFQRLYPDAKIAVFKLKGKIEMGDTTASPVSNSLDEKKTSIKLGGSDIVHQEKSITRDAAIDWVIAQSLLYCSNKSMVCEPLTHYTISLMEYLKRTGHTKYELFRRANTSSPLYCLFLLERLTSDEVNAWWAGEYKYDNLAILKEQTSLRGDGSGGVKNINKSKDAYLSQFHKEDMQTPFYSLIKEEYTIGNNVPDKDDINWILTCHEFCYLLTIPLINAMNNSNGEEVKHVLGMFKTFMLKKKFGDRSLLCKVKPDGMEQFCTVMSFFTSKAFCHRGFDWDKMVNQSDTEGGEPLDGVFYGWGDNIRPNIQQRTSFYNRVAKYWVANVKSGV
jgi:hypothetical protein